MNTVWFISSPHREALTPSPRQREEGDEGLGYYKISTLLSQQRSHSERRGGFLPGPPAGKVA